MRRGFLLLVAALLVLFPLVACGEDEPAPLGAALGERWLRLGEDPQTSILSYEGRVPPNFVELLNPDRTPDTPEEDLVLFPVHPDGEILGSYVLRMADGRHLVWLMYDVPHDEREVEPFIADQLDDSPWQVTGMQVNSSIALVRFQSTVGGTIEGTAVVQPHPAAREFQLTIDREGSDEVLWLQRGAYVPVIEASIDDELRVTRVPPGSARLAGLHEGDRIVAVHETAVGSHSELSSALGELARTGERRTGVTYIIEIQATVPPDDEIFVLPPGRTLPSRFPALDVWEGLTVLDYTWVMAPGGRAFQAGMVTLDPPTDTANRLRDALEADGWEIVEDRPSGFATVLEFAHADERLVGTAQIDVFPPDDDYTLVFVQLQTGGP